MARCPVCKVLMDHVTYEGVPTHNCGSCGGYWLTRIGMRMILARREVAMPEAVEEKMLDLARTSDTQRELRCPTCERPMVKKLFDERAGPRLDFCRQCDGVWLDRAELEACQISCEQSHAPAEAPARRESNARAIRESSPRGEPDAEIEETDATGIPIRSVASGAWRRFRGRVIAIVLIVLAVAAWVAYTRTR
jgi:Zn-finger nucleic acid-binding protein